MIIKLLICYYITVLDAWGTCEPRASPICLFFEWLSLDRPNSTHLVCFNSSPLSYCSPSSSHTHYTLPARAVTESQLSYGAVVFVRWASCYSEVVAFFLISLSEVLSFSNGIGKRSISWGGFVSDWQKHKNWLLTPFAAKEWHSCKSLVWFGYFAQDLRVRLEVVWGKWAQISWFWCY